MKRKQPLYNPKFPTIDSQTRLSARTMFIYFWRVHLHSTDLWGMALGNPLHENEANIGFVQNFLPVRSLSFDKHARLLMGPVPAYLAPCPLVKLIIHPELV